MFANTTEEALAVVRTKLATAQLNKTGTVIAATKGGTWRAVAYKGNLGWAWATEAQQAVALPDASFPPAPPTALEVYLKVAGKQGGTIHQAIADVKSQGRTFRERLVDELSAALWDRSGAEKLMEAACY